MTNLSYVLEVNGGIEVGDILDAGLDYQVLLAGVGKGAKGHNPLRWTLVIATPPPSAAPPETPSSSTPAPITTSEPPSTSTAPPKAHDCRLCKKRLFEAWGSGKLGKYQRTSCMNPTLQALTDEIYNCGFRHARSKLLSQRHPDMKILATGHLINLLIQYHSI